MLKIYGTKTSSNVQKVLWCCGELDLAFECDQNIGGPSRNDRTAAYLALNPNGLIPTIDEDGFILWESNVVVRYLSAKYGMGTLCPADLAQRADCERWMDWQQTALVPHMGVAFRGMLKQPPDAIPEEQLNSAVLKAGKTWKILDTRLADRRFVGGDSLTMGDIALGNAVHRWFKLPIARPDLRHLQAWYGRLCERPAYREHIASL
jgi:glutathione S-transferase